MLVHVRQPTNVMMRDRHALTGLGLVYLTAGAMSSATRLQQFCWTDPASFRYLEQSNETRKATAMQQCAASLQTRFCAEVPVTCIPANYRKRLPRQARLCYVEEPVWDADNTCYFIRIGGTPQSLASSRPLRLSIEEAETIFQSLDTPTIDEQPLRGIPSYLLPDALRDLDGSRSYDLGDELAQVMLSHALTSSPSPVLPTFVDADSDGSAASLADMPEDASSPHRLHDHWFVAPTSITDDQGRCLVSAAPLAHRLSGRSSGPVYNVWLDAAILEQQAMPVDASFDHLDCHEQRLQVNVFAIGHGAIPPAEEPEPTRVDEAAFTATMLEEQYQLVPLKDPIYLRKEDVLTLNSDTLPATSPAMLDTQTILTNVIAIVQRNQASLAQQRRDNGEVERLDILLRCLEETLDWYKHLRCHKRGAHILSLSPLDYDEDEQVYGRRQKRQARCIQLVVGVPTTLPLPWQRIANWFIWPKGKLPEQGKPRTSMQEVHADRPSMIIRQAAGVRIVA